MATKEIFPFVKLPQELKDRIFALVNKTVKTAFEAKPGVKPLVVRLHHVWMVNMLLVNREFAEQYKKEIVRHAAMSIYVSNRDDDKAQIKELRAFPVQFASMALARLGNVIVDVSIYKPGHGVAWHDSVVALTKLLCGVRKVSILLIVPRAKVDGQFILNGLRPTYFEIDELITNIRNNVNAAHPAPAVIKYGLDMWLYERFYSLMDDRDVPAKLKDTVDDYVVWRVNIPAKDSIQPPQYWYLGYEIEFLGLGMKSKDGGIKTNWLRTRDWVCQLSWEK